MIEGFYFERKLNMFYKDEEQEEKEIYEKLRFLTTVGNGIYTTTRDTKHH